MIVENGTLGTSKATLYTCGSVHGVRVVELTLVNTGSVSATVNIYVQSDGTNSRNLSPSNLVMAVGDRAEWRNEITLQDSDLIEGQTSSGSTVEWNLHALEFGPGSPER